jgi:hypothetical protein
MKKAYAPLAPKNRIINGVMELPKDQAVTLMPYDTVTVQGFYRSQPEVNDAIAKAAKAKGAYAFFIVRQGGGHAWDLDIFSRFAAFRQSGATGFGIRWNRIRALQYALLRILFIDISGDALVAALVGVNLTEMSRSQAWPPLRPSAPAPA